MRSIRFAFTLAARLPLLLQGLHDRRPTLQGQDLLHHTRSINLVPMTSLLVNKEGLRMRLRNRSFLFPTSSMHRPLCLGASNHLPSGSLVLYTEKCDRQQSYHTFAEVLQLTTLKHFALAHLPPACPFPRSTARQTKEVHRLRATILQCHLKGISFQPRSL